MTTPHPDEEKLVLSEENVQVARDIKDALVADDMVRLRELNKKLIMPLESLKLLGKEHVKRLGLPTTTAEMANDTDWLK